MAIFRRQNFIDFAENFQTEKTARLFMHNSGSNEIK